MGGNQVVIAGVGLDVLECGGIVIALCRSLHRKRDVEGIFQILVSHPHAGHHVVLGSRFHPDVARCLVVVAHQHYEIVVVIIHVRKIGALFALRGCHGGLLRALVGIVVLLFAGRKACRQHQRRQQGASVQECTA